MSNFRFYRDVTIFPGLGLEISRSGPSLSLGVWGAHITVGRRGVSTTLEIPGTGIYYTSRTGRYTGIHSAHRDSPGRVLLHLVLLTIALLVLIAATWQ